MKRMRKGFTLLELLMVIMVIAILIGIALPRFRGMVEEGNIAKAKGELRTLQTAVESYYMHSNNVYPATGAGLNTAIAAAVPNIIPAVPNDPFNGANAYGYTLNGNYYAIWSVGAKGTCTAVTPSNTGVTEAADTSCIYVSNAKQDTTP